MWALFADLAKKIWYTKLTGSKKVVKSVALRHIFLTAQGRFNEKRKTTFHHNKINDESSNGKHLGYNKCSIHPNSIPQTVLSRSNKITDTNIVAQTASQLHNCY